jgi:amino acid transporter
VGTLEEGGLQRHFGLLQATAMNVTMVVGAGVFITIPFMLDKLPGPYAMLGWVAAGVLVLFDSLIWSELGAALPGSGGSYVYLLECYGRQRWGRLMAFLFIWQFLLSGPLELASGLIAMDAFSQSLDPGYKAFNEHWTWSLELWKEQELSVTFSPGRLGCVAVGGILIALLYRHIQGLGRLTVLFGFGILAACAWILLEGWLRFDPGRAFDFTGKAAGQPENFASQLGQAMIVALYSYLGYYNICYIGVVVRDPGRTIPRSILLSVGIVFLLFLGLHLAMLGVIPWHEVPTDGEALKSYSLAATFMDRIHGPWAVRVVTLLLMGSCFAAAFSGLLGYSRIPYGAARQGHFFQSVAHVHPVHCIPHISLLLVGGLTLLWSFFDLQNVITALIITRILTQFAAQIIGLAILRRTQPQRPRPFRLWLYPLPCGLALVGWLYVYATSGPLFISLGLVVIVAGVAAFLLWSRQQRAWPYGEPG